MQDNFHLLHRTVRHAPPNITNTIRALCMMLREHKAHEVQDGRKSYDLPDHVHDGILKFQTSTTVTNERESNDPEVSRIDDEELDIDEEYNVDDFEAML